MYYLRDRVGKATRLKEVRSLTKAERAAVEKSEAVQAAHAAETQDSAGESSSESEA